MPRQPRFTCGRAVHHVTLRSRNREFLFAAPWWPRRRSTPAAGNHFGSSPCKTHHSNALRLLDVPGTSTPARHHHRSLVYPEQRALLLRRRQRVEHGVHDLPDGGLPVRHQRHEGVGLLSAGGAIHLRGSRRQNEPSERRGSGAAQENLLDDAAAPRLYWSHWATVLRTGRRLTARLDAATNQEIR